MKLVSATKNIHNELVLMEDKPSRKKTKLIKDKFGKKLTVRRTKVYKMNVLKNVLKNNIFIINYLIIR